MPRKATGYRRVAGYKGVSFNMKDEQYDMMKAVADHLGMDVSSFIRSTMNEKVRSVLPTMPASASEDLRKTGTG